MQETYAVYEAFFDPFNTRILKQGEFGVLLALNTASGGTVTCSERFRVFGTEVGNVMPVSLRNAAQRGAWPPILARPGLVFSP